MGKSKKLKIEPALPYVISSRVRVARNLAGYPFPWAACPDERATIVARVRDVAVTQAWFPSIVYLPMNELYPLDRRALEEKRLISPEFARPQSHRVAMIAMSQKFSILVNEEDHLRIQAIQSGLRVFTAWQRVSQIERALDNALDFAYCERDGYLTTCSSNAGSGIRASVMLFLPALLRAKQISGILQHVHAAGYTVRGMYGEGSHSFGALVQISGHLATGQESRQRQSIQQLYAICKSLISEERRARRRLLASAGETFTQNQIEQVQRAIYKAEGIGFRTGMGLMSKLRLATVLRMEQHSGTRHRSQISFDERLLRIDRLTMCIQPAHVLKYGSRNPLSAGSYGSGPDYEEKLRAKMMQQSLNIQAFSAGKHVPLDNTAHMQRRP